jgi:hypothetical protein
LVPKLFWFLVFSSLILSLFFFFTEKLKILMFSYLLVLSFVFFFYIKPYYY